MDEDVTKRSLSRRTALAKLGGLTAVALSGGALGARELLEAVGAQPRAPSRSPVILEALPSASA